MRWLQVALAEGVTLWHEYIQLIVAAGGYKEETKNGISNYTAHRLPQVDLAEGAALRHGYIQLEAPVGAAHTKSTFVQQAARSSYTLTEACLGAQLARHDVNVQQVPSCVYRRDVDCEMGYR